MDQGIRFVITGDTTGLENAAKQAESALEGIARKISQLQKDIGANISISQGYEKAIESLSNELKAGTISQDKYATALSRLQRDEKETTIATNSLRKELSLLQRDQKGLLSSTGGVSKSFNNLNKSTANAVPTLTSFSQVIQDAPYGIRGVANNITQLTSQFGYLQKSAGGTGAALKGMLGTLAGPAGILLAVSAVTSLMVAYGDKLTFNTSATNKLAKATKEYLGDALAEGVALKQLVEIAKDETNSKIIRQKAIEEINNKYSKYLGNLDLESVKTDAVTTSVRNLTAALIQKAKVQGLEALITEKTADKAENIVDAELKREKALRVLNSEVEKAIKGNAFLNQIIGDTKGSSERLKALSELTKRNDDVGAAARSASVGVGIALDAFTKSTKEVKELNKELDDSLAPLVKLQETFKKGLFNAEGSVLNLDDGIVNIKASLKDIEKLPVLITGFTKEELRLKKLFENIRIKANDEFDKIEGDIPIVLKVEELDFFRETKERVEDLQRQAKGLGIEIVITGRSNRELDAIENKLDTIQDIQRTLNREGIDINIDLGSMDLEPLKALQRELKNAVITADIFSNAIGASFSALASDLSQSLSTGIGVVDGFVSSIIGSLAQLAAELIAQAIAQAVVGNAVANAAAAASAITAAAAGAAASAQGVQIATSAALAFGPLGIGLLPGFLTFTQGLITAALVAATIPKGFAQGGIVGGGRFTGDQIPILVNSGERILTVQDQSFLTNVLRSGASATTNSNQPDMIVGEVILRGTTQVIQLKRAEKKMNRYYNS